MLMISGAGASPYDGPIHWEMVFCNDLDETCFQDHVELHAYVGIV